MPSHKRERLKRFILRGAEEGPCCFCRVVFAIEDLTCEHIRPRSAGGRLNRKNTALSCSSCNVERQDADFEAFACFKRGEGPRPCNRFGAEVGTKIVPIADEKDPRPFPNLSFIRVPR